MSKPMMLAIALMSLAGVLFADFQAEQGEGKKNLISGRVVGVVDGDTLDILTSDRKSVRIRLWGIDAPEKSQPFGQNAKQYLSRLAYNCTATVDIVDTDRYGRHVGRVHACGTEINEAMIQSGHAWVYREYVDGYRASLWNDMEKRAKDARKGLWAGKGAEQPVPPWEWREMRKKQL